MTDDINALRARISELEALIFSSGKPISQFGTISLPRSVVEQALYHLNRGDADAVCWADGVIKPALEQPQRKLTPQDIADSTLLAQHVDECHDLGLGGTEQHEYQRIITDLEAASEDDYAWSKHLAHEAAEALRSLLSENKPAQPPAQEQPKYQSGGIQPNWKLVPVEPTREMLDAARKDLVRDAEIDPMLKGIHSAMLAAAPHPPAVEQPQNEQEPVGFVRQIDIDHIAKTQSDWGAMFGSSMGFNTVPLYTHPQPKRELTDEQIAEVLIDETNGRSTGIGFKTLRAFARAIERAHGIVQGAAPQPLKDEHAPGDIR